MIRAFLAVQLADSLKAWLETIQTDLKRRMLHDLSRDANISWVRPASLHVTMKFLGDIDEGLVRRLEDAISYALAHHRPFYIPLDRLGVFPRLQQPRVLWIGPSDRWEKSEEAARLTALHRSIEDCCLALNLAPDTRPLSAHLTLARINVGHHRIGQALAKSGVIYRCLEGKSLPVDAVVLMRSELKPTGSVYTKLWEARLQAA
jgi:RNA 2',3'-cyclic 3'-phosphodiesterase